MVKSQKLSNILITVSSPKLTKVQGGVIISLAILRLGS